jgi:hypothetical protein
VKTIFDLETRDELLERLARLTPQSERQWGKMTPSQMMEHTARGLETATGAREMKQKIIGKALSWVYRNEFLGEKPFRKNAPTGPDFKIKDDPDFEATRERLKLMIGQFCDLAESGCHGKEHGFFGPLTGKQWGETQYKHVDHHLRQFGV